MSSPSDPRLLVLHGLRLRGFGEAEAVAAVVGLDVDVVASQLAHLVDEGLVLRRDGRLSGWALTAPGRAAQEAALAAELDAVGVRAEVDGAYRAFLGLNGPMLQLCTDWQVVGGGDGAVGDQVVNDHTDAAYDAAVVARLADLDVELAPVLGQLEAALGRYAGYRPRFGAALARVLDGDHDWFTKPMIDSYHTVWFQLHEDLLTTLGFDRASEATTGETTGPMDEVGA